MGSVYLRVALAAAAAAALLATSTPSYTAWQLAHAASASAGASVDLGASRVLVASPGGEPREVTADGGAAVRTVVGDVITVEVPVTVHTGEHPLSVLRVEVPQAEGDAALAAELAANPTPVEVVATAGAPDLAPVAGDAGAHVVTPASDGATYLLRWSTSTRSSTDGEPAGADNRWGEGEDSLQSLSVGSRPLTVRLEPGAPAPAQTDDAGQDSGDTTPTPDTPGTDAPAVTEDEPS